MLHTHQLPKWLVVFITHHFLKSWQSSGKAIPHSQQKISRTVASVEGTSSCRACMPPSPFFSRCHKTWHDSKLQEPSSKRWIHNIHGLAKGIVQPERRALITWRVCFLRRIIKCMLVILSPRNTFTFPNCHCRFRHQHKAHGTLSVGHINSNTSFFMSKMATLHDMLHWSLLNPTFELYSSIKHANHT